MNIFYFGKTDKGRVRNANEDAFLLQEVWEGTHLLAVVADGVGGNGGGDVASNLACKCIREHINGLPVQENSLEALRDAVIYANNTIFSGRISPRLASMCCVITAVLINTGTGEMSVCHIGDTRLYMLSNGQLTKITSDHSIIGALEESGEISETDAMKHPRRNIITRCIGSRMLQPGTDYIQAQTLKITECTLLICSDGLYDMVTSTDMVQILTQQTSAMEKTEALIKAALEAGGRDNVTAVAIDMTNKTKG